MDNEEYQKWLNYAFDMFACLLARDLPRQPTSIFDAAGCEIQVGDIVSFYSDESAKIYAENESGKLQRFVDVVAYIEGDFYAISLMACNGIYLSKLGGACSVVGNIYDNATPLRDASAIFNGKLPKLLAQVLLLKLIRFVEKWPARNAAFAAAQSERTH